MRRLAAYLATGLIALVIGAVSGLAVAQTAADATASQIAPAPGTANNANQTRVPTPLSVATGQITHTGPSEVGAAQLSTTVASAEAPPALSNTAQGRDAHTSAIKGHDRCDPAAPTAGQPACDNILDQKGDQFAPPPVETAKTADPDAPSSALVNDIVGGGTGTVVIAPTDPK